MQLLCGFVTAAEPQAGKVNETNLILTRPDQKRGHAPAVPHAGMRLEHHRMITTTNYKRQQNVKLPNENRLPLDLLLSWGPTPSS